MAHGRRHFMMTAAALGLHQTSRAATALPKRKLGSTGLEVTVLGLGGARTGTLDDGREAQRIIRSCYDRGINYFDSAAAGAYGLSQARYGQALHDVRDRIVFGTKTRNRSYTQSELDLNQSLANLRTDYLDLYQIHNVINDEDIDFIFGSKGVMEMVEKAKKAGKVRFVGVTGHTEPAVLNRILSMYDFDTVLMPLSVTDGGNKQKSFEHETVPVARKKGMGIIAMKTLGAGSILRNKAASVEECLRYTLSLPISTAIMGCDHIEHIETDVKIAQNQQVMSAEDREILRRRVASRFELAALEPWKQPTLREQDSYRAD